MEPVKQRSALILVALVAGLAGMIVLLTPLASDWWAMAQAFTTGVVLSSLGSAFWVARRPVDIFVTEVEETEKTDRYWRVQIKRRTRIIKEGRGLPGNWRLLIP